MMSTCHWHVGRLLQAGMDQTAKWNRRYRQIAFKYLAYKMRRMKLGCEFTMNETNREFAALATARRCCVAHPIAEVVMG